MRPTRYKALGYERQGRELWRFIDAATGAAVGPQFKTRAELLAALEMFAATFGATEDAR